MLKLFRGRLVSFCLYFSLSLPLSPSLFLSRVPKLLQSVTSLLLSLRQTMTIAVALANERETDHFYDITANPPVLGRVLGWITLAQVRQEVPEPERRATTMRALVFARASSRKKGCELLSRTDEFSRCTRRLVARIVRLTEDNNAPRS